jgi:hypothetical protein
MRKFAILFVVLLQFLHADGQDGNVSLMGESGDGKTVKLVWFFKAWDKAAIGFNVMRRTMNENKNGTWEKLNPSIIQLGTSASKPLQNVEPDENEAKRLSEKLQMLIAKKSIREISTTDFLQRLGTDAKAIQGIAYATALNYDVALISGFALIDRSTAAGNTYQYGLFIVKQNGSSDNPAATFTWRYGTTAQLDVPIQLKTRTTATNNQLQLRWNVEPAQLKQRNAAGFNVYKQSGGNWVKLNYGPLAISTKFSEYTFMDSTANALTPTTYAVALQSMFGNEGKRIEYRHDPSLHPLEYRAAELDSVKATGENFDKGFQLKWRFDPTHEKFLKGFVVEKANLPQVYKTVSTTLPPNTRTFVETSPSPPASYVQFKVTAIYKDDESIPGNEKLFYYLPVVYAPKPVNFKGTWVKEKENTFIDLAWDPKTSSDSLTDGYYLYALNPADGKVYLQGSIPMIKGNAYRYKIFNTKSIDYRFAIAAVSRYKTVGHTSDTIGVLAPTVILPIPIIYPYSLDTGRVTLQWKYDAIADLKGFRVFQNGNMVASEYELKKDARMFVTPVLKFNDTYLFTIQAVTERGIESPLSMARDIYIFTKPKS